MAQQEELDRNYSEKMENMMSELERKEAEKVKLETKIQQLYNHFQGAVSEDQQQEFSQTFQNIVDNE